MGRLDDRPQVVAQAIVGAGREHQGLGVVVLLDCLEQGLLRDRAEDAVLAVHRRIQVDRVRARQHHAMVHGLVAVAIQQHLLARRDESLEDDFVAGGRAIGGEEGAAGAECLGGLLLRFQDDALGLHQGVQGGHRDGQVGVEHVLAHELVEVVHPGAVAQRVARAVARRVPGILGHQHVALQRVVERRVRALLELGVEDAVDAAMVALLTVEVAVHRLGEQRVDHFVFLLLGDEDVDVELRAQARDPLHQLECRHLQHARSGRAVALQRIERVVDDHRLDVAIVLDRFEGVASGRDAGEADAQRVVQALGGGVQALDELLEDQGLIVDDENAADRVAHAGPPIHGAHDSTQCACSCDRRMARARQQRCSTSPGLRERRMNSGTIVCHAHAPDSCPTPRARSSLSASPSRAPPFVPATGRSASAACCHCSGRTSASAIRRSCGRSCRQGCAAWWWTGGWKQLQPEAFEFLVGFARDNELRLREGREVPRPPAPGERADAAASEDQTRSPPVTG